MDTDADPIGFLYTPLEEAAAELRRRREDQSLCSAVAEFQKDNPPTFLSEKPIIALARAVFTPDDEMEHLLQMAKFAKLSPLCMELTNDLFVPKNPDKHCLCKLSFVVGNQVKKLRIVDFHKYERKPFSEIQTLSGQRLIDFHRCLIDRAHPDHNLPFVDNSDWVHAFGTKHLDYFPYLALFVTQAILLENFMWGDEFERKFTEDRVIPAFEKVIDHFGVKPLIVRLYEAEEESDPKHWQYDGALYPFAKELLENGAL